MSWSRQVTSFLWPHTKKFTTQHSGEVEITWLNGKKLLDSKNANYSYGILQKVMAYGLERLQRKSYLNVLILGMGGGSVLKPLQKYIHEKARITAVELDPIIIKIAAEEFNIEASENFRIVEADAFEFVKSAENIFDLVIIDLFIDREVPEKFYSAQFWNGLLSKMTPNAEFIFNAGVQDVNPSKLQFLNDYNGRLRIRTYQNVMGYNTLIIGKIITGYDNRTGKSN